MMYNANVVDALLNQMEEIVNRIAALNASIPEPAVKKD